MPPSTSRACSALALALACAAPAAAWAQDPADEAAPAVAPAPLVWSGSFTAGGWLDLGNVRQVRAMARGHLSHEWAKVSNDADLQAVLIWWQVTEDTDFVNISREATLTDLLAYHVTDRFEVLAFGRYESSMLRAITHRGDLGAGAGATVFEDDLSSGRLLVAALAEATRYDRGEFELAPEATGALRVGPRAAAYFGARTHSADGTQTWRASALAIVNPLDTREFRATIDGAATLQIVGPLGLTLSGQWTFDRFNVVGVSPWDLRLNVGLSVKAGSATP
jgi:hypothetical protein